jgi:hypothetical protein
MKYNELKYLTAHNAYAAPKYGYQLIDPLLTNQKKSVTDQLNCGVRGLMLDIYWDGSEKVVCAHGSSTIIAHVDLAVILDEISDFLRCNGREIVTIFFEDYLSDHYRKLADALQTTGYWFDFSAYDVPRNGWPEVETMLANGHRIVAFLEKTTDRESMNLPYLYDYAVETVYGDASLDHNSWVKKRDESSILSGGSGKLRREDTLAIVNHFKTVPAWSTSDYEGNISSEKNLIGHIDDFYDEHGRTPNTIATDFIGSGFQRQALEHLNRIKPDFVDTKHSGWLVGNSVDWDSQASFRIPDGRKLVGVRVYNERGYGLIDIAFCHAPADALDDTHERECGTPIFGLFDKGQEYAAYAPPGMAIDGLTVAKYERYGLVNLKIHFGSKGSGWLTKNEGSDAEMIREGPRAGTAIRKIAVRSEGGHGLVDLKYYWK